MKITDKPVIAATQNPYTQDVADLKSAGVGKVGVWEIAEKDVKKEIAKLHAAARDAGHSIRIVSKETEKGVTTILGELRDRIVRGSGN